ncbi:MAG: glycosyltransferase [Candidatus Aminicenantes bacterium]|nr:MAG: glycosyltransferase [Candidatus Aminicenantes bacterium]
MKFYSFKRQYPRFLYPGKTDKDSSFSPLIDAEIESCLDSMIPFTWFNVARKIVRDKPDITIFPWWVAFWAPQFLTIIWILKLFSKTKILFICHNILEHEKNRRNHAISKCVLSRGDYFIVHSEEEKARLIEITGKTHVKVNFHPTYETFKTRVIPRDEAKETLQIREENIMLFFGFVREYKGLTYLIQAMPEILNHIDTRLVIAGEFWEDKSQYLKLIQNLDLGTKVTIIDRYIPNEEIPHFFYASDIVILPYSSVTGSGLVQLAFGFEKPVVVSKVGALSEVVCDRKTGFLVSPRSPGEIAKAVVEFFRESDRDEMVERIKEENKKFSWDHLVRTIESFGKQKGR